MIIKIYIQANHQVILERCLLIRFMFNNRTGVGSPLAGDYRNRF